MIERIPLNLTVILLCKYHNLLFYLVFLLFQKQFLLLTAFLRGSDAMLTFGGMKAWEGLRVLSKTGCRPFCLSRDGLVQGEGAAVFVLEEYTHAYKRGANILAEIKSCSMTSDGYDLVAPSAAGV